MNWKFELVINEIELKRQKKIGSDIMRDLYKKIIQKDDSTLDILKLLLSIVLYVEEKEHPNLLDTVLSIKLTQIIEEVIT